MEGIFLRKASKFLTGQAQDSIIPVPTFICAQCGKVNEAAIAIVNIMIPIISYNFILLVPPPSQIGTV